MSKRITTQWFGLDARMTHPGAGTWTPNTNLYDRADAVVVLVELAGVAAEAVEVHAAYDKLVISGCRRDPVCDPDEPPCRVKLMEMDMGHFERIIPLPCRVDSEHASARCRNGMLEIRLPKVKTGQVTQVVAVQTSTEWQEPS